MVYSLSNARLARQDGAPRQVLRTPGVVEENAVGSVEEHLIVSRQLVLPFEMALVRHTIVPQHRGLGVPHMAFLPKQGDKITEELDLLDIDFVLDIDQPACCWGSTVSSAR